MKRVVVAVRDSAVGSFSDPICVPSRGVAIRSFRDEANRREPGNQIAAHPSDFELWALAEFDVDSGVFDSSAPERLARAVDLVEGK